MLFADALAKLGVEKGDRVAIYMGMVPEVVVAMLACARLGAIHSVVFGGFSADALADRIRITSYNVCYTKLLRAAPAAMLSSSSAMLASLRETPSSARANSTQASISSFHESSGPSSGTANSSR